MAMESTVRRRRDAEAMRAALLAAGREVFASDGFEGATIREMGARAGANPAMISYHFGGKQGLFSEVLTQEIVAAQERIARELEAVEGPTNQLGAFMRGFSAAAQASPTFVPLLARELTSAGRHLEPEVEDRLLSFFRPVRDTLREAVETGEFRVVDLHATHISLVGGLIWFALTEPLRERATAEGRMPAPRPSWAGYVAHMQRLFERGLSKGEAALT
jgi:AcrR family transcriptional regulator